MDCFTVINCDEWCGVYKNNCLLYQNHSLSASMLIALVGGDPVTLVYTPGDETLANYVIENGGFPATLENMKRINYE